MSFTLHTGDVSAVVRRLRAGYFDACFCDPPYGLGFMGKAWDHGVPSARVWKAILRVLKPGAPILAFGGTRTYHRLAAAIEDAGAEIRDQIDWLYGQGFAKALDVQRAISCAECTLTGRHFMTKLPKKNRRAGDHICPDAPESLRFTGWHTALQPAHEPICFAMKPIDGTFAQNALVHGVGGLNIEATRIATAESLNGGTYYGANPHSSNETTTDRTDGALHLGRLKNGTGLTFVQPTGRWPKNVVLSHAPDCRRLGSRKVKASPAWNDNRGPSAFTGEATSPVHHADADGTETVEAWECVDGCVVRELDTQSGQLQTHGGPVTEDMAAMGYGGGAGSARPVIASVGGASRFFQTCNLEPGELAEFFRYVAKASRFERDFGCEHFRLKSAPETVEREEGTAGMESPRAGAGRTTGARNHHPTVKPIALTQYVARIPLPPPRVDGEPRRLLVPFSGVGSEVIGALRAGWDEVHGIELDPEYVAIAEARIARWMQVRPEIEPDELERVFVDPSQGSLFGKVGT
jgi:hypothetical protein